MAAIAMIFGGVLIALGAGAFMYASQQGGKPSPTALIPAGFGLILFLLGMLARKENVRKHAMHAAAAIGLIGAIVPGMMGLPGLFRMMRGEEIERPAAAVSQSAMAAICAVFVLLCVRSFISARRNVP